MRCFPHCCPAHVERSYCGGSLIIKIDTFGPRAATANCGEQHLQVFGRFELVDGPCFEIDAHIPMEMVLKGITESTSKGTEVWLQAERVVAEEESAMQEHSEHQHHEEGSGRIVFVFNRDSPYHWPYDWKGGTSKLQRSQEHHFRAYAVVQDVDSNGMTTLRVVGVATSSSFTVGAYMKTPQQKDDCQSLTGCELSGMSLTGTLAEPRTFPRATSWCASCEQSAPGLRGDSNRKDQDAEWWRASSVMMESERLIWTRQNQQYVKVSADLAILFRFMTSAVQLNSTSVMLMTLDRLWRLLSSSHRVPGNAIDPSTLQVFIPVVDKLIESALRNTEVRSAGAATTATHRDRDRASRDLWCEEKVVGLLESCIDLLLWMTFSCGCRQKWRQFVLTKCKLVLNRAQLWSCFVEALQVMQTLIEAFFQARSGDYLSLDALVNDIVSVTFELPERMEPPDSSRASLVVDAMQALLQNREIVGIEPFVAQMREVYVCVNRKDPVKMELAPQVSRVCGRWVLETITSSSGHDAIENLKYLARSTSMRFCSSVWDTWMLISQLIAFDVRLSPAEKSLSVQSVVSVTPYAATMFILDGRMRTYRLLANGLSTLLMTEQHLVGDYAGRWISSEDSVDGDETIELQLFFWDFKAQSMRLTIEFALGERRHFQEYKPAPRRWFDASEHEAQERVLLLTARLRVDVGEWRVGAGPRDPNGVSNEKWDILTSTPSERNGLIDAWRTTAEDIEIEYRRVQ